MPVIQGGVVSEGLGTGTPYQAAQGAPVNGTNAIQTLTGTATSGTFTISFSGFTTTPLNFNDSAATIAAAVVALPNVGASGVAGSGGLLGTNPVVLTFGGNLQRLLVPVVTINSINLAGGTVSVANTTPGVTASARLAVPGARYLDLTNGKEYINTGTAFAPTWTVLGSQT